MKPVTICGCVLILLCLVGFPSASTAAGENPLPQLRLRGEAVLQVPADRLNLNIGVTTDAATVEKALGLSSKRMEGIVSALEKVGLKSDEYQTSRFNIQPQWSPRPKQAPTDWRPRIVGYTASSQLSIHTTQMKLAGRLIEAATTAGANEVGSIYFDLADPRSYRAQAIETAAANARSDAQTLAKASGVKIVRVLSVSLDQTQALPRPESLHSGMLKAMAVDAAVPPIEAGDITVRAGVEMVCEIAPVP